VNLVDPATAAVAGIFLFVVPGLVFLALLGKRERDALRLDETLFLSVIVMRRPRASIESGPGPAIASQANSTM